MSEKAKPVDQEPSPMGEAMSKRICAINALYASCQAISREQDAELAKRDKRIAEMESLASYRTAIDWKRECDAAKARIAELEAALAERDKRIALLEPPAVPENAENDIRQEFACYLTNNWGQTKCGEVADALAEATPELIPFWFDTVGATIARHLAAAEERGRRESSAEPAKACAVTPDAEDAGPVRMGGEDVPFVTGSSDAARPSALAEADAENKKLLVRLAMKCIDHDAAIGRERDLEAEVELLRGEVPEAVTALLARAEKAEAEVERLKAGEKRLADMAEDLAAAEGLVEELKSEIQCPRCYCATQADAEANECGCDAPVCSRETALGEAYDMVHGERDRLDADLVAVAESLGWRMEFDIPKESQIKPTRRWCLLSISELRRKAREDSLAAVMEGLERLDDGTTTRRWRFNVDTKGRWEVTDGGWIGVLTGFLSSHNPIAAIDRLLEERKLKEAEPVDVDACCADIREAINAPCNRSKVAAAGALKALADALKRLQAEEVKR